MIKLPEQFLCKKATRECWMNTCPRCKNGQGFQSYFDLHDMDTGDDVTWYVWKNDENDQLCKMIEEGIVEDLRDYIGNITPKFLVHCYVKRQQAAKYSKEREAATSPDLDASKALLQVDYSENYTCVYQDEIQSAHWKQHQSVYSLLRFGTLVNCTRRLLHQIT